jgi:hypothetical protein
MPDRPGETKPTICSVCSSRFNVHMTGTHSVFVRAISASSTIGVLPRTEGSSSTAYEVLGHVGSGPFGDWRRFLMETQTWVEPMALPKLVSMTATVSAENEPGTQLTADSLCKKLFLRIDATPSPGINRSMVRIFIKIIFFGGAFQFPAEIGQTTWRTPFSNKLVQSDLIQAYARCVLRRLRSKFILTAAELPDLLKFFFPPDMTDAEESLRKALADS